MGFFDDDFTTVEGTYLHETDKAVLVEVDGDEVWIPFSCCDFVEGSHDRGDSITLEVATWFAEKEGM